MTSSIAPILAGQQTAQSFHHISAACHRLVLPPHAFGADIYAKVKSELESSVSRMAREWRGSVMSKEGGWLEKLVTGWRDWEKRVVSIAQHLLARHCACSWIGPSLSCLGLSRSSLCQRQRRVAFHQVRYFRRVAFLLVNR